MKSFTLDGKRHRIHPRISLQQIRWLVGRQHVRTPDAEIEELIVARAKDWPRAARLGEEVRPSVPPKEPKPREGDASMSMVPCNRCRKMTPIDLLDSKPRMTTKLRLIKAARGQLKTLA
ncbi:hypothetical protein [Mesorhizobium sp.]|uniref:hypothetical protein n=1 Tax=Mesorhizobium sp. TaxID=1871066 RepID=UPI000FE70431|nr:hypothetical protein [Mesorhizobium sp.]RWQ59826.1 MAG: hypothetical protein EOS83_08630 [Mesorhizobium sp.]